MRVVYKNICKYPRKGSKNATNNNGFQIYFGLDEKINEERIYVYIKYS